MEKTQFDLGNLLASIKYPLITEKATVIFRYRQYTFIVDKHLTKTQIKFALEKVFEVEVESVNTCFLPSKQKRVGRSIGKTARYKKAYVTLKEGQSIANLYD